MAIYPNTNYTPRALEGNYINDSILQLEFAAEATLVAGAPLLMFDDIFPRQDLEHTMTINYMTKSVSGTEYNEYTDPQRRKPAPYMPHGPTPRIDVSGEQKKWKNVQAFTLGYDFSIANRALASNAADLLQKQANLGYAWSVHWNETFLNDMTQGGGLSAAPTAANTDFGTGVTTDTYRHGDGTNCGIHATYGHLSITNDSDYYWSEWEADADPLQDIMDFQTCFNGQLGYDFALSDVYINDTDWKYLKRYLLATDRKYGINPMDPKTYTIGDIFGVNFHVVQNVADFKDNSLMFGISRAFPAGDTYVFRDTFGIWNGLQNFNQWTDPNGKITHLESNMAVGSVVRKPKALGFVKVNA